MRRPVLETQQEHELLHHDGQDEKNLDERFI